MDPIADNIINSIIGNFKKCTCFEYYSVVQGRFNVIIYYIYVLGEICVAARNIDSGARI
jgi:hypothetical protein